MSAPSPFYTTYQKLLSQFVGSASIKSPPISPLVVGVSQKTAQRISNVVKILYKIALQKPYQKTIQENLQENRAEFLNTDLPEPALLMSYDFHIDSHGDIKLIEVNTNSSGYLISHLVDETHITLQKNLNLFRDKGLTSLKAAFKEQWQNFFASLAFPHHLSLSCSKIL